MDTIYSKPNIMNSFGLSNGLMHDNMTLNEMPADKHLKIREALDVNPPDMNWRALIRVVEDRYHIRSHDIETWALGIHTGQSPASRLLTYLGASGMTVKELAKYLDKMQLDPYKFGLVGYEDIDLVSYPKGPVELLSGDTLTLEVNAKGHPYPRYQWFFCGDNYEDYHRLEGRTERVFTINNVSEHDGGLYACQIHNCQDPQKTLNPGNIVVTVSPRPVQDQPKPDLPYTNTSRPEDNSEIDLKDLHLRSTTGVYSAMHQPTAHLIVRQPKDVMIGMNEPFVVAVETHGSPPIRYEWTRNGKPIHCPLPAVKVDRAGMEDFGEYQCQVSNPLGSELSRKVYVREHVPQPVRKDIVLISNPKTCTVQFGGSAIFRCEAKCSEPLQYQWFKDGRKMEGKTQAELKFINIQEVSKQGMYQCEISVQADPSVRCLTSGAMLNVDVPAEISNVEYNPSDKVALLIGNYDYRSEECLTAPITDVQVLSEAFRSLDFKVVALLNLTKPEIESAVHEFSKLIGQNVYAVFYFCGHGFEESGFSFMVPTDAPAGYLAKNCVNSYDVIQRIQQQDPALICCILDICRKPNKIQGGKVETNPNKRIIRGNTVTCFATSEGMNAYEDKRNGLLVQHLQPLLRKHIGIEDLMKELRMEFGRVEKHATVQIPELQTNLREPNRSLADKISWEGNTQIFQERTQIWLDAHKKPQTQRVHFPDLGVLVELDFQSEISNVLHVFAIVKNKGVTEDCTAYIINWPATVAPMGSVIKVAKDPSTAKTTLQDIQKLQNNLTVSVALMFKLKGSNEYNRIMSHPVNLGLPLVAKLQLWKPREGLIPPNREATESAEDV